MNIKKVMLCWSVAVTFFFLFTACTKRVEPEFIAPKPTRDPLELVAEEIMTRIRNFTVTTKFRAGGEPIYAGYALAGFYKQRNYRPVWTDEQGFTRPVNELVNTLRKAEDEGLRPNDYHLVSIENLVTAVRSDLEQGLLIAPDRLAAIDILLTDAFLVYGAHLQPGRVNQNPVLQYWVPTERSVALANMLEVALATSTISNTLEKLAPSLPGYQRLCEALMHYRKLTSRGGWTTIPSGPKLKRGDHGPAVKALRERLRIGGDLDEVQKKDSELFDEALELALKRFQQRHGMNADGILSDDTRVELNISVERRVEQLEVNLERQRWLSNDWGQRYILVNIPAFHLEVMDDAAPVIDMRVIVGQPENYTPILNDTVRNIVLNPSWSVPRKIAANELFPRLKRDRSFPAREKVLVFKGAREVDPMKVDWSTVKPGDVQFCQNPGPLNPLGRIKFVFLNKYNVYLHDTPAKELFKKTQRDFSHGCIRIEKPVELALYLLRENPQWNHDTLLRALGKAKDRWVDIPDEIPIHLVYWSAWVDHDGTIQFRRDIYGWDAPLLEALRTKAPNKN